MKNRVDKIKKKSIYETVIPFAAVTSIFSILYGIYRYGFYSPHRGQNDDHRLVIPLKTQNQRNLLSWLEYSVKRFGKNVKIILGGISMGAGTILMTSELDLPENVKGILADCPFTSPEEIIMDFGKSKGFPMKIVLPLTALSARLFRGLSLSAANAVQAVKKTKAPILIIHGEDDTLVPPEMSLRIAEANPAMIERYTFPGAEHGISYLIDPERYANILDGFCKKNLLIRKRMSKKVRWKYEML